jgi:hypothetical protein
LTAAGCRIVYLDGSFVTNRDKPGDFDACWEPLGVDPERLGAALVNYHGDRWDQKAGYGGELFPSSGLADITGRTFLDLFQIDKWTRRPKGIVAIQLGDPP